MMTNDIFANDLQELLGNEEQTRTMGDMFAETL